MTEQLCEDEGCPHFGTPHICISIKCSTCQDQAWVCENHLDRAWNDGEGCCGGAGAPCPDCNPCDENTPPRMPTDSTLIWDRERGYLN